MKHTKIQRIFLQNDKEQANELKTVTDELRRTRHETYCMKDELRRSEQECSTLRRLTDKHVEQAVIHATNCMKDELQRSEQEMYNVRSLLGQEKH